MKTAEVITALEILQNPTKVREILQETPQDLSEAVRPIPHLFSEEIAAALVVEIAEDTATEDPQFAAIYEALKNRQEVSRDWSVALDYAGKAYTFIKDHWGEIFFILMLLDKKGYFNKLKKKAHFKDFFAVLFEEEKKVE